MAQISEKSQRVSVLKITEARLFGSEDSNVHKDLQKLVNDGSATRMAMGTKLSGDCCTVIISVPKWLGGSFSKHPGHCGIALWNSQTLDYQSFGILEDGTFMYEEVNAKNDIIKRDRNFKIWYYTKKISSSQYNRMQKRIAELGKKTVGYGKVFVFRGVFKDGSFSCVSAVDTILVAGGLSTSLGSLALSPYGYAQTFTRFSWFMSYADNHKHM